MSDMNSNLKSDAFWIKTLFIIAFALAFKVLGMLVLLLTAVQWVFSLVAGEPNEALKDFCAGLAQYMGQVTAFLTGASSEKPYPFSDWPSTDRTDRETLPED